MKHLIILFGAPGCGKGHLSTELIKALKTKVSEEEIFYISTGDLIRSEIAEQTELGKQISLLVQNGKFVPDHIVDQMIENALAKHHQIKILDGYPRNMKQLSFLMKQIKDPDINIFTIFRDTPEEIILKRIKDRRVCKDCKKTHTSSDKQCPYCGGESVIREDDAKIEPRLQSYRRHTLPLWDILDLTGNTYRVDGTVESDIIADNVVKLLF